MVLLRVGRAKLQRVPQVHRSGNQGARKDHKDQSILQAFTILFASLCFAQAAAGLAATTMGPTRLKIIHRQAHWLSCMLTGQLKLPSSCHITADVASQLAWRAGLRSQVLVGKVALAATATATAASSDLSVTHSTGPVGLAAAQLLLGHYSEQYLQQLEQDLAAATADGDPPGDQTGRQANKVRR